jgi:hypothetical protein
LLVDLAGTGDNVQVRCHVMICVISCSCQVCTRSAGLLVGWPALAGTCRCGGMNRCGSLAQVQNLALCCVC